MGDSKRKVNDGMDASSHPPGWGGAAASGSGAGVGASLREARQRLGVELRDVAEMLRIRYVFLQAIEDGRYGDLPGTAYAAGFLRSYAEYLGLDADGVVRRFKDEVAGRTAKQELYFPTPVPEGRVPGGAVLLAVLVLAGTLYGGWYYLSATDRSMVDLVPALPDRLVSLLDSLPYSSTPQPVAGEGAADGDTADGDTADGGTVEDAPPVAPMPQMADAGKSDGPTRDAVPESPAVVKPAPAVVAAAPVPATGGATTTAAPAPAPAPVQASAPAKAPAAAGPAASAPAASTPAASAPAVPVPSEPVPGHGQSADEEPEGPAQEPTPLSPTAPALPSVAAAPGTTAAAEAAAAVATDPTRVYGTQNQDSRIQLRATQDSWVQVRDGKGELLFTRVLRPGDVYRVPERSGVRLRTGNAGGLIVVVDGVAGAPLGASGQVLRDVALDAPTLR